MRRWTRRFWLLLGLAGALAMSAGSEAQQAAVFQIDFTNPQLMPSHWQIKLNPDGTGHFDAEGLGAEGADSIKIQAGEVHREIQLSQSFTEQVFATARRRKLFAFPCESRLKVAFQGTKRLSYSGPEGSGECEFNYSKDKDIQALGDSLMAVETTLIYGARLDKLLVHDRLGLDREMENLVTAAKEGQVIEVGAIRETLTRIATDEQVMDRARRKARLLLAQAN